MTRLIELSRYSVTLTKKQTFLLIFLPSEESGTKLNGWKISILKNPIFAVEVYSFPQTSPIRNSHDPDQHFLTFPRLVAEVKPSTQKLFAFITQSFFTRRKDCVTILKSVCYKRNHYFLEKAEQFSETKIIFLSPLHCGCHFFVGNS